ncbi:MAG: sensor histidine kinase [Oscillospiraceae bacterium]
MLIADIFLCIIKAAMSVVFAEKLCGKKCSHAVNALLTLLCGSMDFAAWGILLWQRCVVSLAVLFLVCFAFLKIKPYRALSAAVTCIYIRTAAELAVSCLMFAVMRGDYAEMMNGTIFNHALFGLIAAAIYCGLLYLVWYILSQQPQETFSQAWRHYFFVVGVFLVAAAAFGSLFEFSQSNAKIAPVIAAVAVLTIAMSIVVINFFAEICVAYAREKQLHHLRSDYCSVKEQLDVQFQTSQRLRKVRHDIKNHLMSVSALIDRGECEKARELLSEISNTADRLQPSLSQSTGNSLIDAVITYKAAVSEIRKIPFEYSLELLPEIRIDLSDISSVISNLLDNALEAAEKTKDPYVEIRVFMYKDYLTIFVKNRFDYVPKVPSGLLPTTKKDNENHGLGMTIVSEICERYSGVFRYSAKGAWFSASAMMKNI